MIGKQWKIRHKRTGLLLGWLDIEIAPIYLEPSSSPRPYTLAIYPQIDDVMRVPMKGGEAVASDGNPFAVRSASVIIDTRSYEGRTTLWVERASELNGHADFHPWW